MLYSVIKEALKSGEEFIENGRKTYFEKNTNTAKSSFFSSKDNTVPTVSAPLSNLALSTRDKLPYVLLHLGQTGQGDDFTHSFSAIPENGTVKILIAPTRAMTSSFLAFDLKINLIAGIYAGAFWEKSISLRDAARYADQFVTRLMSNTGKEWYDDGKLSNVIKNTPEGKALTTQISSEFEGKMSQNQGDFTKIKLSNNIKLPSFSWKSSPTLKILVGGTQEMIVRLDMIVYYPLQHRWTGLLSVEIKDDFGVTEGDITHASFSARLGTLGLADFWALQHDRDKRPFTTVFKFSFFCNGSF